jgi:hypothetical protein
MSDVERVVTKVGGDIESFIKAVIISTFNGVIRDTRVDTGRLRGNWQVTENSPASGTIERADKIDQGKDGGSAQSEVRFKAKPFTVMYLTNNLPYAKVWEDRDGMIVRNVARVQRNIQEAIRG